MSPHKLRYGFARAFLRNGGDVFSLQRMLGHTTLEMSRRHAELTLEDVQQAQRSASPADRLGRRRP
jgi:site-specific recombinase XerD